MKCHIICLQTPDATKASNVILFMQRCNLENMMQTHAVYVGNFSDSGVTCEVCFQAVVYVFSAASVMVGRASVRGIQEH
jgi:hypothetical protein